MKIIITVEDVGNDEYKITTEDEVAITSEVTRAPQRVIAYNLKNLGIKGKRGRRLGQTIQKTRNVDPFVLESLPIEL